MKWKDWLENWGMTSLRIKAPFLDMVWEPKDKDKDAAWELYIELLTRITTQPLLTIEGDEALALKSIHKLFDLTRECIKNNGRGCMQFARIAIVILNQKVRPFTSRWHKEYLAGAFGEQEKCKVFRDELGELQKELCIYTDMLGDMAGVERSHQLSQLNDI